MKIGIFGPGVGAFGITVALRQNFPALPLIHYCDNLNNPYGSKPPTEIGALVTKALDYLVQHGCDFLVIGCNTSALSPYSGSSLPDNVTVTDVVSATIAELVSGYRSQNILLLATTYTVDSKVYSKLLSESDAGISCQEIAIPKLATLIDQGKPESEYWIEIEAALSGLSNTFKPNAILLACTHFPLIKPIFSEVYRELFGSDIEVISQEHFIVDQVRQKVSHKQDGDGSLEVHLAKRSPEFSKGLSKVLRGIDYTVVN